MASGGGDDLDDESLRAMRTVWLSMRDEEPSGRGMADLMAAARAQVATRRPESGWKRAIAALAELLRRPPVLALATVVVVAGTAVLLESHGGIEAPHAPAAPMTATATTTATTTNAVRLQDPSGAAGAPKADRWDDGHAAPTVPAPPSRTVAGPGHGRGEVTSLSAIPKLVAPPPAPAKTSSHIAGLERAASKPAADARPAASPQQEEAPPPSPPSMIAQDAKTPAPPSNDQLLRECEAAAARGDCTAVRAMIDRLRAQAPDFFRTTVARDPALAKCLPAADPKPVSE